LEHGVCLNLTGDRHPDGCQSDTSALDQ